MVRRVAGDGFELPGGKRGQRLEFVVIVQRQGALGSTVDARGNGVLIVDEAFGYAGVDEKAEAVIGAVKRGGDFKRGAVDGEEGGAIGSNDGDGPPWAVTISERKMRARSGVGKFPNEFGGQIGEGNVAAGYCSGSDVDSLRRKWEGRAAESGEFWKRAHFEMAVRVQRKDAGEGHAAGPACGDEFGVGAFFGDPAPEDAVAVGIELSFLGVVGAVVEDAGVFLVEF